MTGSVTPKLYPIRRPVAAFCAGAAVALLGGLIGLGGAEFRLPLLVAMFQLYPQRAIRINLLISFATLVASAAARLGFVSETSVSSMKIEIVGMIAGGVVAAWIGAGAILKLRKEAIVRIMAALLLVIAVLLVMETVFAGSTALTLPADQTLRAVAAIVFGIAVGAVSSLLGVAGGELIIPTLIFAFGADIRTAGTTSVLISLPIVAAGLIRHIGTGHFRSRSMLGYLVLPVTIGSLLGAIAGSYLAAWCPTDMLRFILAAILAVSAGKLMSKHSRH